MFNVKLQMSMQSISKFFIISLFFVAGIYNVNAQAIKQKSDSVIKTVFRGLRVDVDLSPVITNLVYNGQKYSYEAGIYADLKQKYYPAVEIGFAGADITTTEAVVFKTSGMFGRVGVDFNLMKPKKDKQPTNNIFFAGVRLAFSPFSYNITNINVPNDYWGSPVTQNFNNETTTKVWFEIIAGMRVEISKRIYMGWTARNKNLFGEDVAGEVQPWYIPGFGTKGTGKNWGINYSIGYKF